MSVNNLRPLTLSEALDVCRKQFQDYRDYHINKMTPDSLRKAATNQEMIDLIDEAIKADSMPKEVSLNKFSDPRTFEGR